MSLYDRRREGGAKQGVDFHASSVRRREQCTTLRKKRHEQELKKFRECNPDEAGEQAADVSQLPMLVAELHSAEAERQLLATIQIRRMLALEHQPPIDAVIQHGCVQRLVEFLKRVDIQPLQFEAAWALTNIASGTSEHTMAVIAGGAVPLFIELLSSPSEEVREQSVWALGNIAGDSVKCRDLILNLNVIEPLLRIASHNPPVGILRNVTWALSNLCRGKPIPDFAKVQPALPMLAFLLGHHDEEVLVDACWAISYLSDGPNDRIEEVLKQNVHTRLIELLKHQELMTPALRTIGNIVTGTEQQTQTMISCGMLPRLHFLLSCPKKATRKECCWAISNITAGSTDQIQAVINAALIPPLIKLMTATEFEVRKEAAWAISNATSGGTREQVKYLVGQNLIEPMCELLSIPDAKIIMLALEALENILRVGDAERDEHHLPENPWVGMVQECGGADRLESLQVHPNQEIYELSLSIMEGFFETDDIPVDAPRAFQFQPPGPGGHVDPSLVQGGMQQPMQHPMGLG
eukprot:Hpha_TRINITY_DN16237_c1_g12::TRINITY_DN16237_c1_g12_i1::g.16607::m.16607